MNKIITIALCFFFVNLSNAQKIESEKIFGGYKFTRNENTLNLRDISNIMEDTGQLGKPLVAVILIGL